MASSRSRIKLFALLIGIAVATSTCAGLGNVLGRLQETGLGIFASQSIGESGALQLHFYDGHDAAVPRLTALPFGVLPRRARGEYYELRLSPDDWSDHVLAYAAAPNIEDGHVQIFNTRHGFSTFGIAASLPDFFTSTWREHGNWHQFQHPPNNVQFVEAYWVASDAIVLRFRFLVDGVQHDDMLARLELADVRDGPSARASAAAFVDRFRGRGTGRFAEATNPRKADDDVRLNSDGEFLIGGEPTTGGPSGVRTFDAVLYFPL